MMKDTDNLFEEFKPLSKEQWKAIAIADLKGGDFEDTLVWKTHEGFDVQPYYTKEDIRDLKLTETHGKRGWISYQEVRVEDEKSANQEAHKAQSFDVGGLLFRVDNQADIGRLLDGIDLSVTNISFAGEAALKVTHDYFGYLKKAGIDPKSISGYCDHDVLGLWITEDKPLDFEGLARLIELASSSPHFRVVNIHSGDFVNAGCNFTQELAFTLNKSVEYIDRLTALGVSLQEVVENLHFEMAITGDFFFEIAKLNAFRRLIPTILGAYEITGVDIPVLASSSLWSKSRHDYHVNMIRNTTEAMSAILGGADALLINAHNSLYESPTAFGQRIAANLSNLLREESYLDKVDNPVTGTYYVESITYHLAQRALDLFREIEKKGGLISSIKTGDIQKQIGSVRNKKEQELQEKRFVMIGTNRYAVPDESLKHAASVRRESASDGRELLFPRSLAEVWDLKEEGTTK